MMTVWRIRAKIIITVLYCVRQLYTMIHTHTHMHRHIRFRFSFREFVCVQHIVFFSVFLRLFCSCIVCCHCVRLSFFSTVPRDWLGWTYPKWPVFVEWDVSLNSEQSTCLSPICLVERCWLWTDKLCQCAAGRLMLLTVNDCMFVVVSWAWILKLFSRARGFSGIPRIESKNQTVGWPSS